MKWLSVVISFVVGVIVSGLMWDELSHQMAKRGWTKRVCDWTIFLGCQLQPARYRGEYQKQAEADVAKLLSDKRHLAAIRVGMSFFANGRGLFRLLIYTHYFTLLGQGTYFLYLSTQWTDDSLVFIPELAIPLTVVGVSVIAAMELLLERFSLKTKMFIVPLRYKLTIILCHFCLVGLMWFAISYTLILFQHGYPVAASLLAYNFLMTFFLAIPVCSTGVGRRLLAKIS